MQDAKVPSVAACLALLEEAGAPSDVVDHVKAVHRLAMAMCDHAPGADRALVGAGALLHDIGRSVTHGLDHVVQGVLVLRAAEIAEPVVRIVQRHVGAGITDAEAADLGWPVDVPGAYMPASIEERIVAHADNLTFGTRYGALAEVVAKLERKGLAAQARRAEALHAGLHEELGVDADAVARRVATSASST